MYTNGQTINYKKYQDIINKLPAPILANQLPKVHLDLAGLMKYAHNKGIKAGDLTDEEKNRYISNGTVQSMKEQLSKAIKNTSLSEWNASRNL